MKQISKEIFQEMLKMGLLNTQKGQKNFTVTCSKKGGSRRKKHYVSMPDYLKFVREKSKFVPRGR